MMNQSDEEYLRIAFDDVLDYGAENPLQKIFPLTYRTPEGDSCLHIAALRGDSRALRILLEAGMDVNLRGDMGATPLHMAFLSSQSEAQQILRAFGADGSLVDEFGRRPQDIGAEQAPGGRNADTLGD